MTIPDDKFQYQISIRQQSENYKSNVNIIFPKLTDNGNDKLRNFDTMTGKLNMSFE